MERPQPYDSPFRWLFHTTRIEDGEPVEIVHLADIAEGEEGECTCEDHIMRKRQCKHIRAAREELVNRLIQNEKNEANEHRSILREEHRADDGGLPRSRTGDL